VTKPNPLHVEKIEHAQPHAANCQDAANILDEWALVQLTPGRKFKGQRAANEVRAAADYIGRREQQWEALKKWVEEERADLIQRRAYGSTAASLRQMQADRTRAEMDRLDAALRATGERER